MSANLKWCRRSSRQRDRKTDSLYFVYCRLTTALLNENTGRENAGHAISSKRMIICQIRINRLSLQHCHRYKIMPNLKQRYS